MFNILAALVLLNFTFFRVLRINSYSASIPASFNVSWVRSTVDTDAEKSEGSFGSRSAGGELSSNCSFEQLEISKGSVRTSMKDPSVSNAARLTTFFNSRRFPYQM